MNGAQVIYVCMNSDCPFPWRPEASAEHPNYAGAGPCTSCGVELSPALVYATSDKLAAATARVLPKLGIVAAACREVGHPVIADEVEKVAADLTRAKDGMP